MSKTGAILYFDLHEKSPDASETLSYVIPDNTLCGMNDYIPGLAESKLPMNVGEARAEIKLSKVKPIFCHGVRISSMTEIEHNFEKFLNNWVKE